MKISVKYLIFLFQLVFIFLILRIWIARIFHFAPRVMY